MKKLAMAFLAVAVLSVGACSSSGGGAEMMTCAGCKKDVPAEKCCKKDTMCDKCDKCSKK